MQEITHDRSMIRAIKSASGTIVVFGTREGATVLDGNLTEDEARELQRQLGFVLDGLPSARA